MQDRGLRLRLLVASTVPIIALAAVTPGSWAWTANQETYLKEYTPEGNFLDPVTGPSAPNSPDAPGARLWLILAQDTGLIQMDYSEKYSDPFNSSHQTILIRIQSLGFSPPLSNVLYLVPGRNGLGGLEPQDDLSESGLLAFVANHRLVLLDPFGPRIFHDEDIGFQPQWFTQDVVSSGDMYGYPMTINTHTYRFIVAANQTHLSVYRVDYRSSQDSPPIPTGGVQQLISENMSVLGMPLAYYLQYQNSLSGIFVPRSDSNLTVFSIDGSAQTNLTLSLGGEPASVSAPLGYRRAPESQIIYVPLKSQSFVGVAYLTPWNVLSGDIRVAHVLQINDEMAVIRYAPDPANSDTPYIIVNHVGAGGDAVRGLANGSLDPSFDRHRPLQIRSFFYSPPASRLFALDMAGTIWSTSTTTGAPANQEWVNFSGDSMPRRTYLGYMGSWSGTKYSTQISSAEVGALAFNMATGSAIAFKLMTAPDVWDGGDGDQSGAGNPLMMYALILVLAFVMVAAVALVLLKQRIPKAPQ